MEDHKSMKTARIKSDLLQSKSKGDSKSMLCAKSRLISVHIR